VVIQSFDERTLQVLHRDFPAIKTALLIEAEDLRSFDQQLSDLGFTPFIYSPAFTLVTPRLVQSCHSMGMKVIPWTVNSVVVMKQLRSMGVDGLISDYPNLYAELR
jgi:glycerophosphoryl diester phosphodiesterase